MTRAYSGYLITFEGPDGGGKTTLARYLEGRLEQLDLPVLYLREPGGTRIGEKIRNILKDGGIFIISIPMTFLM